MDLEPGVTLNMIIVVAPWPMGGAPPIGSRGSIGTNRSLTPSVRVSDSLPLCRPAFLQVDPDRQERS